MERLSLSYCAAARAAMQGGKTKGILLCPPLKRFSDYKYPMKLESEIFRAIASEDRETAIEIFSRRRTRSSAITEKARPWQPLWFWRRRKAV